MAEAAGLALAVLPLLISAAESYRNCIRPIERFLCFNSHVRRFQDEFNVQRTIFRNQCRILLVRVVEDEVATCMLQDTAHPSWQDHDIDKRISCQLRDSKEACATVIGSIKTILKDLEGWSATLTNTVHAKEGTSTLKAKLKLSFDEQKIDKKLSKLKGLNGDFRTLSSQTSELHERNSTYQAPKRCSKDIARVRSIQQASCGVYKALSESCSKHTEHRIYFGLEAATGRKSQASQISFQIAFTRPAIETHNPKDLIFVLIESLTYEANVQGTVHCSGKVTDIDGSLKRAIESETEVPRKKVKKSVTFSCSAPVGYPQPKNDIFHNLKNLCTNRNFCDQLRMCLQQTSGDCYLGTLDDLEYHKHLVYFPRRRRSCRPASLQEIILKMSRQGPQIRLSQFERCSLARSLATSVLQYYSTPWLTAPLRSQDILFFDVVEGSQKDNERKAPLLEPHINVEVKQSNSTVPALSELDPGSLAPNAILYHLGVLLIEIAFIADFAELLDPEESSRRDRCTDFFAAKKLATSVSSEMGAKYQRIVQKCLGCHFAAGYDLNDSVLQAEYYTDVVLELEGLEKRLQAFQLSA